MVSYDASADTVILRPVWLKGSWCSSCVSSAAVQKAFSVILSCNWWPRHYFRILGWEAGGWLEVVCIVIRLAMTQRQHTLPCHQSRLGSLICKLIRSLHLQILDVAEFFAKERQTIVQKNLCPRPGTEEQATRYCSAQIHRAAKRGETAPNLLCRGVITCQWNGISFTS